MGAVINKDAYANFNASFGKFVENSAVKGSTIAKIDQFTLSGVNKLEAGEGDFKGNLFRDAAQIANNNRTRAIFKKSVADIFGGENKIPNSVKAAMKWDDFDGTGRPLTARRISATWTQIKVEWTQIKVEEKCDKIRNALNAQDWFAGSKISDDGKAALGSYIEQLTEQLSSEMTQAMEKLLLPSIQKGEAPSVKKMKTFLKQFQKDSTAARKILDGIKNSQGHFDAKTKYIDDKTRQRIIDVRNATSLARGVAFALALAKNTDLANFFFDTSKVSNQAFKNFSLACDEIEKDYRNREFEGGEGVNANEGDSFMSNIEPLQRMAGPARAYYIMGMSTEDAVEELMRLSKDGRQKELQKQGKVLLRDAVVALELTPGPKAKDILAGFFKKVGEQILDGTIRKKNEGWVDLFYEVMDTNLKKFMMTCMKNRELNDAKGTTDNQPEWVMGSVERDFALMEKLDNMFKKPFIPEKKKMGDVDFATHMFICKDVAPGLENMENAKGKFLSLGNGAKVSNEKPTPAENKATRTFLIKLLDDQGKSTGKFTGGPDPVISAVKMILAHDLTKEITYGEVFDLFRNVLKSRRDSPTVQRECEKIKEKQETIRASLQKSLNDLSKVYDDDLADRNAKNSTNLVSVIRPDRIFNMIESLNPRVLQLRKNGTDVLKMVEEWATEKQRKVPDEEVEEKKVKLEKMEKNLEKHGILPDVLSPAFPTFRNGRPDPVSVTITIQFWQSTLDDPNHRIEFLGEDATQLGTWHAQKKMADELIGKYLPNVNVNDSFKKTASVVENMNQIAAVEMEIRNNKEKIGDLNSKIQNLQQQIENPSSPNDAKKLEDYRKAHEFITELSEKETVKWGEEKVKYVGDNQTIKDMLERFADAEAEEDEETVNSLVRQELSNLRDLIPVPAMQAEELNEKQAELKKELDALDDDLKGKQTQLKDQMDARLEKGLDSNDVNRQHSVQKEFLAVQNDGMKYQKYGEILKSAQVV